MKKAMFFFIIAISVFFSFGCEPSKNVIKDKIAVNYKKLIITFNPNDVLPEYHAEEKIYYYRFHYIVTNPNPFPIEIIAFGGKDECLHDVKDCQFSGSQMMDWFNECDDAIYFDKDKDSFYIKENATICDKDWWIKTTGKPTKNITGRYAVWFKTPNNDLKVTISPTILLRAPVK